MTGCKTDRGRASTMVIGRALALALAVLAAGASLALAAERTIVLREGAAAAPLLIERPFNTILIGDLDVVDVVVRDERSVVLKPLKPGMTNIVFLDAGSIAISNVGILVCKSGASATTFSERSGCESVDDQPT